MQPALSLDSASILTPRKRRTTDTGNSQLWRALYYFNLYRLVLGGAFLTLAWSGSQVAEYGNRSTLLFQVAATAFAMLSIFNLYTITRGKPSFRIQASTQTIADIALISIMMHASNGVSSGLGLLMIVSIAGVGVVLPARATMFFAALASLCILGETTVSMLMSIRLRPSYLQIGVLGAGIFMTGFIVSMLAGRIRENERTIEQAKRDLQRQQLINDRIVQNLQSGVIVVDEHDRVFLSNTESQRLLALNNIASRHPLAEISQELDTLIKAWRLSPVATVLPPLTIASSQIQPRISTLQQGDTDTLVVYLDDQLSLDEQAQQHKLASLGRLSAAIAHEIRNPLSALSHAGQLLAENPDINVSDKRLLDIIDQQTDRINAVIESVLQLGRKEPPELLLYSVEKWLADRAEAASGRHNLQPDTIRVTGQDLDVRANRGQLTQILDNLLDNAVTHGGSDNPLVIDISIGRTPDGRTTVMIEDNGTGINDEHIPHLFEPFFTTNSRGTGLGLYISRELAAANGVRLDYITREKPGCCFRLTFSDEPAVV